MMNNPLTISTAQMSSNDMMSDLSDPSSPEDEIYDTAELLGQSVHDDVTHQLAAAGPVGVAAAAAVLSSRKRKHPHHFETNPARRKRQQTRLLRKLRHTIEEYSARVGQQAVVLCCTPSGLHSMQMYKVFGSQPLETVIRNNKQHILQELDQSLADQVPPAQQENSQLHELPPLVIDGIPTQVDKMTQAQLRNFIPEMLKYSTGRSKPGWGRVDCRPIWWPNDLPWANVRSDARTDEEKKRVPWTDALRMIVKNCYMHHGRQDLLQVFKEEPVANVSVQVQQHPYTGTMMQTINNPDGTVSIIQIDGGPNSVVTLADGSQATVVHAIQESGLQPSELQMIQTTQQQLQPQQFTAEMVAQAQGVQHAQGSGDITMAAQTTQQQAAINALQASLSSGGHIILTGADASQLGGIMTVLPVSMYQPTQSFNTPTMQTIQAANLNFLQQQHNTPQNQAIQIAMAPVANTTEVSTTTIVQGDTTLSNHGDVNVKAEMNNETVSQLQVMSQENITI